MMDRQRPLFRLFPALCLCLVWLAMPHAVLGIYRLPVALPPKDSIYWNQKTQFAVRNGDLPNALVAYEHYIDTLTSRDLRDKMTFNWVLNLVRTDPRQQKQPTLAELRDIVTARMEELDPEAGKDLIWRYNYLLAHVALLEGNQEEANKRLTLAIEGYPSRRYADPGRQSLLPDMYNIASRWHAPENINEAQEYLSNAFLNDPRFNYVELTFWKQYFQKVGNPSAYIRFLERLLGDYQKKIEAQTEYSDELRHYHQQLQWILNNERIELQKEEWNKGRINRLPTSVPLGR